MIIVHIDHLRYPGRKLTIKRMDGKLLVTDWTATTFEIIEEEANHIGMQVLELSGKI